MLRNYRVATQLAASRVVLSCIELVLQEYIENDAYILLRHSEILVFVLSLRVRSTWILNISQPYRPPWPVMRIALLHGDGVCFL
jgi:hypothetical protein